MREISYIDNYETWKTNFSFFVDFDVRFLEVDMFGHMNNVASFTYFEEVRLKFMDQMAIYTDFNDNHLPVVGDLQCDYHSQVYYKETLTIYAKVASIGNS